MTTIASTPIPGPHAALLGNIQSLGALLDDIEATRKSNTNRIGALIRRQGGAFPHLEQIQARLAHVEHEAELELIRFWRRHPLAAWGKQVPGLGEKLFARLIAQIGDPSIRTTGHWEVAELEDGTKQRDWIIDGHEERTPAQLRAYCGHGDPQRNGRLPNNPTQAELFARGNPQAKVRAYLIGAQFMRTVGSEKSGARSPYRDTYDHWRERYANQTHEHPCIRCGPSGHPAAAGTPWSLNHQKHAAIRNTVKQFLNDLHAAALATRAIVEPNTKGQPLG